MEIISDYQLLARVQTELASVTTWTGEDPVLDTAKVQALPLLNSCYSECLRLRASVQAIRELRTDIELDGYMLKAGNLVMAPSWLAHYDEPTWSTAGHPANTFWADRFLSKNKSGETVYQNLASVGQYFPYGGGIAICPGRYYAKAEMLVAVAMFIVTFDIEFVGFVDFQGRASRKPAMGNETRGTMRLDRDLSLRIKRR